MGRKGIERGAGRGGGRGPGRMGGSQKAGPGGKCVCPSCGHKENHIPGKPSFNKKCPKCCTTLIHE